MAGRVQPSAEPAARRVECGPVIRYPRDPELGVAITICRTVREQITSTAKPWIEIGSFNNVSPPRNAGQPLYNYCKSLGGRDGSPAHVNLLTLHSAKACEYDVVIMVKLAADRRRRWPTQPNSARMFGGRSPLHYMTTHGVKGFAESLKFLNAVMVSR